MRAPVLSKKVVDSYTNNPDKLHQLIKEKIEEYYDDYYKLKWLLLDAEQTLDNVIYARLIEICPDDPLEIAKLYWILPKGTTFLRYINSQEAQAINTTLKWYNHVLNDSDDDNMDNLLDKQIGARVIDIIDNVI